MPAPSSHERRHPIAAAGVICLRGGEVLLIRRAKPPRAGQWSLPGGRIAAGESAERAALRELKEETGVDADIAGLAGVVDAIMPPGDGGAHFVLIDYAARWRTGEPRAGDDAADARFFKHAELEALGLWDETLRVIKTAKTLCGMVP